MNNYKVLSASLSKDVLTKLRKANWTSDRDEAFIEKAYSQLLGSKWVPAAAPFVRSFGGLSIHGKLWPWAEPIWDQDLIKMGDKIGKIVMSKVVPVASSSYLGDGCVIWIDEMGRYYAVDSEGMIFIGSNTLMALEVLVGETELPEPPLELKVSLAKAYDWNSTQ